MMRPMIACALLFFMAACAASPDRETGLTDVVLDRFSGPSGVAPRFARLQRNGAPTLQIGFRERDLVGAVLLEQSDGPYDTWLGPDETTIVLQSGVLHSTRGLGGGLLASELSQPIALIRARQPGFADRFHTYLRGDDRAVTTTFRCVIAREGARDVTLNTGSVSAQLMSEECSSLTQDFRNLYWVDGQGTIIQSSQWAGPFLGPLSTRVVR